MSVSLTWSVSVSNTSDTAAKVSVTLKAKATGGSYNNMSPSGYIKIDGTKYTFSHGFHANTTTTLATKSKSITRTTSSKSISLYAWFDTDVSSGVITKSGTTTVTARPKYTVTWDANGGGTTTSTAVFSGYTTTFPNMARTGYSLKWGTTSTGGTIYNVGATTPAITAPKRYYAQWTKNSYTVYFNANGGTSGSTTSASRQYNTAMTIPSTATPTRQYYVFKGWATSSTATTAQYTSSYPASTSTAAITLYAVWALAYVPPSFTASSTVPRRTPDQDAQNIFIPAYWTNGKNADQTTAQVTSVKYEYKVSSGSTWTTIATHTISSGTSDSVTTTGNLFSTNNTYDIRITITDANTSVTYTSFISKSSFIWKVPAAGTSFEFGVPVTFSNIKFGTYYYNGTSTSTLTFTDTNCKGRSFIICGTQDAGNPVLRASLNSSTGQITAYLSGAVTIMRLNYICW